MHGLYDECPKCEGQLYLHKCNQCCDDSCESCRNRIVDEIVFRLMFVSKDPTIGVEIWMQNNSVNECVISWIFERLYGNFDNCVKFDRGSHVAYQYKSCDYIMSHEDTEIIIGDMPPFAYNFPSTYYVSVDEFLAVCYRILNTQAGV